MQFLVHQIPLGPPTQHSELLSTINRFPVKHFLKLCNAVSNWIDKRSLPEMLINVPANPRYKVKSPCNVYLTPSTIPFLAKTSLLRSSDMRQVLPTTDDIRGLAFMYANLQDVSVNNPGGPKPDLRSALVRIAWEQFTYQDRLAPIIPRAKLLLIDGNRELSNRPFDLEAEWLNATGIDLEKFMVIGFGYFAGATQHSSLARYFVATGRLANTISHEDCEKFLTRASATYEEFRELSKEFRVTDPLYIKTEFNVLNKRPLIAVDHELIAPIPRFVAYRITEGLYFDLMNLFSRERANPFLDYFGRLFEHYVGRILKWTFGEENVIPEPVYGKEEKRGPDWIVLDGDTALLFECRSSRLRLDSKVYAQREDLIKDTERIFLETLRKYPKKIEELKSGKLNIDVGQITRYEPIIVTHDSMFFEDQFRDIAQQDFSRRRLTLFESYHLMSIGDLEALSAWDDRKTMKQVLLDRQEQVLSGTGVDDFNAFLRRYSREHRFSTAHPLLEQVLAEFFKEHFAIDENPNELPLDDELSEST